MGLTQAVRAVVATALIAQHASAAVDPLTAKGQYLFSTTTGTQFLIKGVAYQQGIAPGGASESTTATSFIDSLADTASCTRDIPLLQELGTNTIRVYAIDPTADHSACMAALDAAGIYVIADLGVPGESINRDSPAWTTALLARYQAVIDTLAPYPNTLGFFAGNEVTNNKSNSASAAFVKAAVRDSKAYIAARAFGRWLGVGYATNDDAETRDLLASYFNCGPVEESVDFWGYNIYEWCGQSTFQESGYEERTKAFADYSVPAFFSEYGCNNPGGADGRVFQDTPVLYSDLMNKVWSGGIVYEFFQEQNDYGLVDLSGTTVTKKDNFAPLAEAIKSVNANASSQTPLSLTNYTPTNAARACPAVADQPPTWLAASTPLPPTPNATLCTNMVAAAACVPAPSLTPDATAALFATVCGLDATACAGITADPTAGRYGPYVMCTAPEQLAHALDAYYAAQGKAASACDFDGQAQVVSPTESLLPVPVTSGGGNAVGGAAGSSVSSPSLSFANATTGVPSGGSSSSGGSRGGGGGGGDGGSSSGTAGGGGAAAAVENGTTLANDPSSPQSSSGGTSGSGTSGAVGLVGTAGWAGSLLFAVGAGVALTL